MYRPNTNKSKIFQTSQRLADIETGIKMVITVLKVYSKMKGPSVIQYRNYKNFPNDKFTNDLLNELIRSKIETLRLDIFVNTELRVLSKNAPVKKRYIRANEAPFMNKVLTKAIMKRSQLRNVFLKKRTLESQVAHNKQRNYCTSLLREEKRKYFENNDTFKISDSKMFWKTVKLMFSNESVNRESITLVRGHKLLSANLEVAETFNAFFPEYSKRAKKF